MQEYAVSTDLLHFVPSWEGTVYHWYTDIAGVWTGGVGHVALGDERSRILAPFGQPQVTTWLTGDLAKVIRAINAFLLAAKMPADELGQHRGDALADILFNCGMGVLSPSNTITKALLRRDWQAAADALLEWCHCRINGVVQVNAGLLSRRRAERSLFLSPDAGYVHDTTGYEVCGADSICNPDEIRKQGMSLWLTPEGRDMIGIHEVPETD